MSEYQISSLESKLTRQPFLCSCQFLMSVTSWGREQILRDGKSYRKLVCEVSEERGGPSFRREGGRGGSWPFLSRFLRSYLHFASNVAARLMRLLDLAKGGGSSTPHPESRILSQRGEASGACAISGSQRRSQESKPWPAASFIASVVVCEFWEMEKVSLGWNRELHVCYPVRMGMSNLKF